MGKENSIFSAFNACGFETTGGICYGVHKAYAVSVSQNQGYYYLDVAARTEAKNKELKATLKSAVRESGLKMSFYANQGSHLSFMLRFNRKSPYEEQALAYLDGVVSILRSVGISPADTCAVCGGGSPDSLCCVSSYQPVHSACMKRMHEDTKDSVERNLQNGSYFTGFIGALLGTVAGLLPSVFTALSMDTIYALLFALVPMAAMWGYKKFNGKSTKGAIVIVVILSLLSVFVLQFMILGSAVQDEWGLSYGEALLAVVETFLNIEGLALIASESLAEFLFMLVGLFLSWQYIGHTGSVEIKSSEAVLSTMRPNPNYANQYGSESEESISSEEVQV